MVKDNLGFYDVYPYLREEDYQRNLKHFIENCPHLSGGHCGLQMECEECDISEEERR